MENLEGPRIPQIKVVLGEVGPQIIHWGSGAQRGADPLRGRGSTRCWRGGHKVTPERGPLGGRVTSWVGQGEGVKGALSCLAWLLPTALICFLCPMRSSAQSQGRQAVPWLD